MCVCVCRFRRAPHRWLSTFFMPINQRVSNSTPRQQRLTHQQKVSYRTPIVSISRSHAPLFGTCLYWRDQFPLRLSLSLSVFRLCPQGGLFFRSIRLIHRQVRLLPSHHCRCPVVWWSELSAVLSQLVRLCNWDDLTDAATFSARCSFLCVRTPVVYNKLSKKIIFYYISTVNHTISH